MPTFLMGMALKSFLAGREFGGVSIGREEVLTFPTMKSFLNLCQTHLEEVFLQDLAVVVGTRGAVRASRSVVRANLMSDDEINEEVERRYDSRRRVTLRRVLKDSHRPFEVRAKTQFALADRIMHRIVGEGLWIFYDSFKLDPFHDPLPLRKTVKLCLKIMGDRHHYSERQIGYYTAEVARLVGTYTRKLEVVRYGTGFDGREPYYLILRDVRWMHRICGRIAEEQTNFMLMLAEGIGAQIQYVVQEFDGRSARVSPKLRDWIVRSLDRINRIYRPELRKNAKMRPLYRLCWGGLGNVPIYFIKIKYASMEKDPRKRFRGDFWKKKRRHFREFSDRLQVLLNEISSETRITCLLNSHMEWENRMAWEDREREDGSKCVDKVGDGTDRSSNKTGMTNGIGGKVPGPVVQ